MEGLEIVDIGMFPEGKPLEQALHKKKQRVWHPLTEESTSPRLLGEAQGEIGVMPESPAMPPSSVMFVECEGASSTVHERRWYLNPFMDSGSTEQTRPSVQSPELEFIFEVYAQEDAVPPSASPPMLAAAVSGDETPRRRPRRKRRPRRYESLSQARRQVLRDVDILENLHFGSESSDGSNCSEDEEELVPMLFSRVIQDGMDTPLDVNFPAASSVSTTLADQSSTHMPHDLFDFTWSPFPKNMADPKIRREHFDHDGVGPTTPSEDIYDIFTQIWNEEIMRHIVLETNRYAQQLASKKMQDGTLGPSSRINFWVDTNIDELYTFFAIQLAMGVVIKSKMEEYWSASEDIFCTPGFRAYMSLPRFQILNTCLHFNNNEDMYVLNEHLTKSEAKLFKIEPIISHLNSKFQALYRLNQNLALDESLLQWKGWLNINQFISNKAAQVGIKTYELCESQTGYLWRFMVHTFKESALASAGEELSPLDGVTAKIVLQLVRGLEYRGHTMWMDNFYNSPALARHLKSRGFDVVGTLRTNRKFVPQELSTLTKSNMRPGQIVGCTSGDVDLMVWRDLNRVATISTYHGNGTGVLNGTTKPILVLDYNIMMGGVDKKDQLLAMYPIERKRTRVWYKKFFQRLLNVSVLNCYIIAKHNMLAAAKERGKRVDVKHRSCRQELIRTILSRHGRSTQPVPKFLKNDEPMEAKHHYIAELPMGSTQARLRRKCCICKKLTHFYCVGCDKSVCIANCFVALHSKFSCKKK